MTEFLINLAEKCTEIMNNPELNLNSISDILACNEHKEMMFLSLAKVFKNIIPLYKIRLHSDKIKHKIENNTLSQYDRDLFSQYNAYIKDLCHSSLPESYKAACELLKSVDHFNFVDRIVSNVLVGTTLDPVIANYYSLTLVDRIKNDITGDAVFLILNQCLDYKYSSRVIEALIDSRYLAKCIEIRIGKEEKYDQNRIKMREMERKMRKGKGFFKKSENFNHYQRKEIKKLFSSQT